MSIVSTLISPYKGYLYGALAVLVVGCVVAFAVHERGIQHTKDTHAVTVQIAKVEKKDQVISATATQEIQHENLIYKQVVSLPAVGDIGVVCRNNAVRPAVPSATSADGTGYPASDSGAGDLYDPSGDLLTIGRSKDALVRDLQAEVASLRKAMTAAHEAHK